MDRLDRLEGTVKHITEILVIQNERIEIGFGNLREEMAANRQEMAAMRVDMTGMCQEMTGMRQAMTGMREDMTGLRGEMQAVRNETRTMREALSDRLDRLIAITLKERTTGVERLASIEERLARLETHVGI
jgi:hypothetical protein